MGGTRRCSSIVYSYDRFGFLHSVGKPVFYGIVTVWYSHCGILLLYILTSPSLLTVSVYRQADWLGIVPRALLRKHPGWASL